MRSFVRNNHLPKEIKHIRLGPCPNGYFWALEGCHDLPKTHVEMSVEYALSHADVYIQNAEEPAGWKKVSSEKELEIFEPIYEDDPNHYGVWKFILPYMPEFYIVPFNSVEGYRIKVLSGYEPKERWETEEIYCAHCDKETLWDVTIHPTVEFKMDIKCLDCKKTETIARPISIKFF